MPRKVARADSPKTPSKRKPALSKQKPSPPKQKPSRKRWTAPSDTERPAPNEPVRPQPPPELVANARASNAEEHAAPPQAEPNEEAREQAMNEERRRLRTLPERRRGGDRDMKNANRWVKERVNVRGMGRFQAHGHARGR